MNTYARYCPNVWVAKCSEQHEKGEIIPVANKYGKENDSIVFNLVHQSNGFYYYSIVRADGFNAQEFAKKRAARLQNAAANAEKKSNQYYEASKEGAEFFALGEPIKIGHHSEKRHRALIERNHNRMGKCVEFDKKSNEQLERAKYWESKSNVMNLSMPECIEYYEFKLEQAREYHAGLKSGTIEPKHSMSLQYANKAVKELEKNILTAKKLWE
jgi:hypothetical protein